jgi:hypothetical protein
MVLFKVWGSQICKQNSNIIRIDEVRGFEISSVEDIQKYKENIFVIFLHIPVLQLCRNITKAGLHEI